MIRHIDEYRDCRRVNTLAGLIHSACTRSWVIMEVCGGQTHNILKYGLEELLSGCVTLIHGPGCPVCVIHPLYIDKIIAVSKFPGVIVASYGDMLRVPGTVTDMLSAKAEGSDIRIIYSPLDAVDLAEQNPGKKIVLFAIGFETTAPANAMAVLTARQKKLKNFFILSAQVLVPPVIESLLSTESVNLDGLLAPGHVCTVAGYRDYILISDKYRLPVAITGFEPVDLLSGVFSVVRMLEKGICQVSNQYTRSVSIDGNAYSKRVMEEVYKISNRKWRGLGVIHKSGLVLSDEFSAYDAENEFVINTTQTADPQVCISGDILKGLKKPIECPAFRNQCTPEHPLGAPMVSSEGVCAAYYRYKKESV